MSTEPIIPSEPTEPKPIHTEDTGTGPLPQRPPPPPHGGGK